MTVPDEGGAAEIAEPAVAETCRARDVRSCVAAIERMFAHPAEVLRAALLEAAPKVRTDHAVALIAFYEALIAEKQRSQVRRPRRANAEHAHGAFNDARATLATA